MTSPAPDSLADRLARVEARLAIGQLPIRYALAVDGRDLDEWVGTFVPQVNCGRRGSGRDVLRGIIEPQLRTFYRSIHQICGHEITLVDADHASGHVYCRAEHEDRGKWVVMAICYADTYERVDGEWFFARRREQHWYSTEWETRPTAPFQDWDGHDDAPTLPGSFPSWTGFWAGDEANRSLRTAQP